MSDIRAAARLAGKAKLLDEVLEADKASLMVHMGPIRCALAILREWRP
jgi:hypothetical protein